MRIVPAPDRLVRDPETNRVVGSEGLPVEPGNLYWARLIEDGDVLASDDAPTHEDATVDASESADAALPAAAQER